MNEGWVIFIVVCLIGFSIHLGGELHKYEALLLDLKTICQGSR